MKHLRVVLGLALILLCALLGSFVPLGTGSGTIIGLVLGSALAYLFLTHGPGRKTSQLPTSCDLNYRHQVNGGVNQKKNQLVKILLVFTASFLLWMVAPFPVQAQSLLPQGTCILAVHGISLTITLRGPNAQRACDAVLHDPAVTKAFEALGGLHETHRKSHAPVWCKRPFTGFTATIRAGNPAIGKAACKGFMSA